MCSQAAGKEHRDRDHLTDLSTDTPIVLSPRATQLLHRSGAVPSVKQQGVNVRCQCDRLVDRLLSHHVDDLDDRDAW